MTIMPVIWQEFMPEHEVIWLIKNALLADDTIFLYKKYRKGIVYI